MRLEIQWERCGIMLHVIIAHLKAHKSFLCIMHPLCCWFILYLLRSSVSTKFTESTFPSKICWHQWPCTAAGMLYHHSDTQRQVPNHAFTRALTLPLCNELLSSFNFLCRVCIVCKVCRLAVDFLHIRSHPHQPMMSQPQATQTRQRSNVFGRLLRGRQWDAQSPDSVLYPFVESLTHCLCISRLNICVVVVIHEDIWLIYFPQAYCAGVDSQVSNVAY